MSWMMSPILGGLRAVVLAVGLSALGTGAALACDNCDRHDTYHDGYHDGGWHDDHHRGDGWHDGDRHEDGCRGDGCRRYAYDGCRDNCERHDDCRDNCYRHDEGGCHDNCYRRRDECHDGCSRRADNYSCYSGRYDCRFEGSGSDERFRERYYDGRGGTVGGGAYGVYEH